MANLIFSFFVPNFETARLQHVLNRIVTFITFIGHIAYICYSTTVRNATVWSNEYEFSSFQITISGLQKIGNDMSLCSGY